MRIDGRPTFILHRVSTIAKYTFQSTRNLRTIVSVDVGEFIRLAGKLSRFIHSARGFVVRVSRSHSDFARRKRRWIHARAKQRTRTQLPDISLFSTSPLFIPLIS